MTKVLNIFKVKIHPLSVVDDINRGLKMEVTFKRILTNEILTTFLPSFFLIGICYSTIFFKQFYFEASVTVNLTVMLVATTLFIRSEIF